ncbi:MAG TPA: hypothetical protein VIF14_09990 [Alphaproteobacteria bacterium]
MSENAPARKKAQALRERAQWYRDYATVCAGDNAWCLDLAKHFDRLAEEVERDLGPKSG